jgi:hypothetical protein
MRTGSVTTIGASPKRILGFTLSILFFLSFTSFAHGSRCEEQFKQVKRPIEEVFYQDKWNSYQYGMCHQNVIRLLRQFEKEGHPVDQMQIVVLQGITGMMRNPNGPPWRFHAVLKWGDTIFDYDSSRHPISVAQFKSQWNPFMEQPFIKAVVIPASVYRTAALSMTGNASNGALIDSIVQSLPFTPSINLFMLSSQ